LIGEPTLLPCTPHGIIKLLEYYGITTAGKEVVVVGRSNIVGKPVAALVPVYSGLVEGERFVASGSFILKAELGKGSAAHEH
jgi:hypothetical protein